MTGPLTKHTLFSAALLLTVAGAADAGPTPPSSPSPPSPWHAGQSQWIDTRQAVSGSTISAYRHEIEFRATHIGGSPDRPERFVHTFSVFRLGGDSAGPGYSSAQLIDFATGLELGTGANHAGFGITYHLPNGVFAGFGLGSFQLNRSAPRAPSSTQGGLLHLGQGARLGLQMNDAQRLSLVATHVSRPVIEPATNQPNVGFVGLRYAYGFDVRQPSGVLPKSVYRSSAAY